MRGNRRKRLRRKAALATGCLVLAAAGPAAAFGALPLGGQVNDDAGAGINKALSVAGGDPTNADVVGGSLVSTKPAVPWSIFQQTESGGAHDQVFSRSFAGGAWTTRGNGTVGGRSSASPMSLGSLNFDQSQDGEVPAIDFAGTGRTVPWATWYENTTGTGFAAKNIFASRFDDTGDANQGKWLFEGQGRGNGGSGPQVPSLNIHTNRDAENPSVAGGATVAGNPPVPWVTWQEKDGSANTNQIFTSKAVKPTVTPNCPLDSTNPAQPVSATGAVATFCWQQVGVERVPSGQGTPPNNTTDTSMNVDPSRDGVEPDIAFTGLGDTVPWVVWYEENPGTAGLATNELVFAARAIAPNPAPTGQVDGAFNWQVVGDSATGVLDNSAHGGTCGASLSAEDACSLNHTATADAEDPRVAAGTMVAGGNTAPWVTWDETVAGIKQVFVSRFVATPTPHFEIVNNGAPISTGNNDSTRPDITFSGNTPYVSWREDTGGGVYKAFAGHFINAASPRFILDESDVPLTAGADVREPISSGCTATPQDVDTSNNIACQGSAIGTPFFLFTNGTSPQSLFADAYTPVTPTTGAATSITQSSAVLNGTVIPNGAIARVQFEFGPTASYGSSTTPAPVGPDGTNATTGQQPVSFSAPLSGLAAGSTIHYRSVVTSDFGAVDGPDRTLTTNKTAAPAPGHASATAGHARVSGTAVNVKLGCTGTTGASCKLSLKLTTSVKVVKKHKRKRRITHKTVVIGTGSASLTAGQSKRTTVKLNGAGKRLLKKLHKVSAKLVVTQTLPNGKKATISSQKVTFKVKPPKKPKKHGLLSPLAR